MLSMQANGAATSDVTLEGVLSDLECGRDFISDIFSLKMLQNPDPAKRTAYTREYPIKEGTTLGQFIDSIVNRHMDEFLFELYMYRDARKGSGHFSVRAYQVWLQDGLITDPKSVEAPNYTFPIDVARTYLPDGRSIHTRVGLGRFFHLTDRTIDEPNELVPQELWSMAPSRAQRILAGHNIDEENVAAEAALAAAQTAQAWT